MPILAADLQDRLKVVLDIYLRNKPPVDQIAVERPLFKALMSKKKLFSGAAQYVVEQIRTNYGGNGQWFVGAGAVTYNNRKTVEQAKFQWFNFHDGLQLEEDRLVANGIKIVGEKASPSADEKIAITNLIEEQSEVLTLGAYEAMSKALHFDGTQAADAIQGLDALLPAGANNTGTMGGIARTNTYWQHNVKVGSTVATMADDMETLWRACIKRGKGRPDLIVAGADFIDAYRKSGLSASTGIVRQVTTDGKGGVNIDNSVNELFYKGVSIQYSPEFDVNFGGTAPTIPWSKRCYFLNTNHITLRPIEGSDWSNRTPVRPATQYIVYMALLWRGALTCNLPSAHGVISLA